MDMKELLGYLFIGVTILFVVHEIVARIMTDGSRKKEEEQRRQAQWEEERNKLRIIQNHEKNKKAELLEQMQEERSDGKITAAEQAVKTVELHQDAIIQRMTAPRQRVMTGSTPEKDKILPVNTL